MNKTTIQIISAVLMVGIVSGCATQRYGREKSLSSFEKAEFTCRDIKKEIASTEAFLSDVRMARADTNGAHVLGFMGDFGIGNAMEGDAAELSGEKRLRELRDLQAMKRCK